MASTETVKKIKTDLRISHSVLDGDLADTIDACLADLKACGVVNAQETDALILNALKLWCRSNYTDDTNKAAAYFERYNSLKASLMMTAGYGGGAANEN